MNLTEDQKQVITGTLLGNSEIEVGEDGLRLVMHSQDLLWFTQKAYFLSELQEESWQQNSNYYWKSRPDDCFEPFFNNLYDGVAKTVTMECLDRLKNIAIMVWFGDSGCLVGRNRNNACLFLDFF